MFWGSNRYVCRPDAACKDDKVRGTAAQALLERGWGEPRVEVATTQKSDSESFIEALREVAERVKERQA